MAIQSVEGIILRRRLFRETSLIVTLFTREQGKVKILGKGVRKGKTLLAANFEPLSHIHAVYYEKLRSDIHLLKEASMLHSFSKLKSSLETYGYASYFSELLDTLFESHGKSPEVFDLFLTALNLLESRDPKKVARVFESKLFHFLGWFPILDRCSLCGDNRFESSYFNARQGGLVCGSCNQKVAGSFVIAKPTVQTFGFYCRVPFHQAVRIAVAPNVEKELAKIGEKFLRYRLEYPLKSTRFLAEITK